MNRFSYNKHHSPRTNEKLPEKLVGACMYVCVCILPLHNGHLLEFIWSEWMEHVPFIYPIEFSPFLQVLFKRKAVSFFLSLVLSFSPSTHVYFHAIGGMEALVDLYHKLYNIWYGYIHFAYLWYFPSLSIKIRFVRMLCHCCNISYECTVPSTRE